MPTGKSVSPATIKDLRESVLRMSQEEFARVLGVSVTTVSRWEQGTAPRRQQVEALQSLMAARDMQEEQRRLLKKRLLVGVALGLAVPSFLGLGIGAVCGASLAAGARGLFSSLFRDGEDEEPRNADKK